MPPQIDTTDEFAAFVSAVITALGIGATAAIGTGISIIGALYLGYKKLAPLIKETRDNSKRNADAAAHLVHETTHNSGSSMKDSLARIELKIGVIEQDLRKIKEDYYGQESQDEYPPF